jgi:hypothetical protein
MPCIRVKIYGMNNITFKGKEIPLQAFKGSKRLRLPDF